MAEKTHGAPSRSLQELARELIETQCRTAEEHGDRRTIWWDDGGYLRDVVREACNSRDEIEFVGLDDGANPLVLRELARDASGDDFQVWYVPRPRGERAWFRDVEESGGRIALDIEELSARLYGVHGWEVFDDSLEGKRRDDRAHYLLDQLAHKATGRPTLAELQAEILTKGHGRPDEYILKMGWGEMDDDSETIQGVREQLVKAGVEGLTNTDEPEELVAKVREWAIAQWLLLLNLPAQKLPKPYSDSLALQNYSMKQRLERILKETKSKDALDRVYLGDVHVFQDAIENVDDVWSLLKCPVNGALDEELWHRWLGEFEDGEYAICRLYAADRRDALCEAYDVDQDAIDDETSPWIRAWEQAAQLAELAYRYETWEQLGDMPVTALYSNADEGTWRIDAAVRRIVVSGRPEFDLPEQHPARNDLEPIRTNLTTLRYLQYLKTLGDRCRSELESGTLFESESLERSHGFFWKEDRRKKFETTERIAVLYIDALRLDLAYELANRLEKSEAGYKIASHVCAGILPSETRFGMGALTPGRPDKFRLQLKIGASGTELKADRKAQDVGSKSGRSDLLEGEGWRVTDHKTDGWEESRHVAYFDTEIDDIGEKDLSSIESKLAGKVADLADFIEEVFSRGTWTRVFVVADHGFVLLPESQTQFESQSVKAKNAEVKRRRVASAGHDRVFDESIMVTSKTPGFDYLDDDVSLELLVRPLQRFGKPGITDMRYYHGGALPQEFILNFLEISTE